MVISLTIQSLQIGHIDPLHFESLGIRHDRKYKSRFNLIDVTSYRECCPVKIGQYVFAGYSVLCILIINWIDKRPYYLIKDFVDNTFKFVKLLLHVEKVSHIDALLQ